MKIPSEVRKSKLKAKLYVVPHDGTFDGDSCFYCPVRTFPYKQGMTLDDIKKLYFKLVTKDEKKNPFYEEKEFWEEAQAIKGAWVLDEKGMRACNAIWDSDPGNDSAVYACNRAAKRVAAEICVKEIK
jgi:hypothetical protein